MHFELTEDQRLIRDSAAKFVEGQRSDPRASGVNGFSTTLWRSMAELGWLAAGIPEAFGGLGGPIENALIAEQLGHALLAGPFLGAAVLGPQLLIAAGDAEARDALLPDIIAGGTVLAAAFSEVGARGNLAYVRVRAAESAGKFRLSGEKTLVLSGEIANKFLVSARVLGADNDTAGIQLFLVDAVAEGLLVRPSPLLDGSGAATLNFDSVVARPLAGAGTAAPALLSMSEHAIACMAAETVGMMEAVTGITAEYLSTRKQFGAPLGSFQVMQHKLADMTIELEMTRALLLVALAAFEIEDASLRLRRFSGVKFATGQALRRVTGSAVQAHGGMGMTQEYPVGRYLQRMTVLDAILGSPSDHRAVCGKLLSSTTA